MRAFRQFGNSLPEQANQIANASGHLAPILHEFGTKRVQLAVQLCSPVMLSYALLPPQMNDRAI